MDKLTKDFGKLADEMLEEEASIIQIGSPSFNWAVGNTGILKGKSVCFFGGENSGKSLLTQLIFAEIQQKDPEAICILFDAEYSFNAKWFKKLGGDPKRLIVRQSNDPTKIFDYIYGEMLEDLQNGAPIKAIAIDSVKSIRYPKDMKKISTDQTMGGGGASYLGSALKGVLPVIRDYKITTIMVQQVYEEMDQYKKMRNPYIVPDGRALKHFCDYMIQVDKLETKDGIVEQGKNMVGGVNQVGHKVRTKCKKNRCAAPYRVAQFTLDYNRGIVDVASELFELAKSLNVVFHPTNEETGKVNPQMWQFADNEPIRGEENIKNWLIEHTELHDEMFKACCNASEEAIEQRTKILGDIESVKINLDDLDE
jgi:RecA/RadA recombinase